jgi:hypothetical protein
LWGYFDICGFKPILRGLWGYLIFAGLKQFCGVCGVIRFLWGLFILIFDRLNFDLLSPCLRLQLQGAIFAFKIISLISN